MKRVADIPTAHANRYMQQLSKHWAHKFDVDTTDTSSRIALPLGELKMQAGGSALSLEISADTVEALDRLAEVVEQHLDRFAHRENGLRYDWRTPQDHGA